MNDTNLLPGCKRLKIIKIVICILFVSFLIKLNDGFSEVLTINRPVLKIGDSWKYIKTIGINKIEFNYTIENIINNDEYLVKVEDNYKSWKERWNFDLNVIENSNNYFYPYKDIFHFPIKNGYLYTGIDFSLRRKNEFNSRYNEVTTVKSISPETLTVNAGTFDVLKIDLEVRYQGETDSQRIIDNKVIETYWFSPVVGMYVKRHTFDTGRKGLEIMELENFSRSDNKIDN